MIAAIPQAMFVLGKEVFKKAISLAPKLAPALAEKATKHIDKGINKLDKKFTSSKGSGIL